MFDILPLMASLQISRIVALVLLACQIYISSLPALAAAGEEGLVRPDGQVLFEDSFDDNKNRWNVAVNQNDYCLLRDGYYILRNQSTKYFYYAWKPIEADSAWNLTVTARVRKTGGPKEGGCGIIIGSGNAQNCAGFKISGDGKAQVGVAENGKWNGKSPWYLFDKIAPEPSDNDLTVAKTGRNYYFFINGAFAGHGEDFTAHGNTVGFVVDAGCEMEADWIRVQKGISEAMRAQIDKGKAELLKLRNQPAAQVPAPAVTITNVQVIPAEIPSLGLFDLVVDYIISDPALASKEVPFDFTWEILEAGQSVYRQTLALKANHDEKNTLRKKGLKAGAKPGAYQMRVTMTYNQQSQIKETDFSVR